MFTQWKHIFDFCGDHCVCTKKYSPSCLRSSFCLRKLNSRLPEAWWQRSWQSNAFCSFPWALALCSCNIYGRHNNSNSHSNTTNSRWRSSALDAYAGYSSAALLLLDPLMLAQDFSESTFFFHANLHMWVLHWTLWSEQKWKPECYKTCACWKKRGRYTAQTSMHTKEPCTVTS